MRRTSTLPSVTQILSTVGLGQDLSRIDADVLEAARERGSAVHAAIEADHYGYAYELDPELKPYLDAYHLFVEQTGHEPIVSEYELVDREWRVVGHPDREGWHQRTTRALYDFKSGGAQGAEYQLAAYRFIRNRLRPKEPIATTFTVQLRRDGSYRLHEIDTRKPMAHGFSPEQVWQAAVINFYARGGK